MIHSKFYLIITVPLLIGFFMIVGTIRLDAQSDLDADGDTHKFTANESYRDRIIPADLDLDEYDEIKFYLRGGDGGRRKVTFFSAIEGGVSCITKGGEGATVKATFSIGYGAGALQPGGTLRFIPGKKGKSKTSNGVWSAGGAGGTAVLYKAPGANITCTLPSTDLADASSCWVILAVAGGGGGAYSGGLCGGQAGKGGNDNTNGRDGYGNPGSGQINGFSAYSVFLPDNYAAVEYVISGGGGGYRPNDENANSSGGAGLFTGGSGGGDDSSVGGGFGYGGGGRGTGDGGGGAGGGGGGGYSGGGGGGSDHKAGGGGGSFVNDAAVSSHKKQGGKDKTPNDGYITYRFKAFNGTRAYCQDVVVELDAAGLAIFEASEADNGSFNGDGLALNFLAFPEGGSLLEDAFETIALDCSHVGSATYSMVTIPQGDESNADNCTFNLRVEDNDPPMAQCRDITLQLDANLTATLTAAQVDDGSYDACGILGQQIDKTILRCADIGTQIVTLHLEDNNENFGECTALVTIEDYADLSISCPANISTVLDPGQCEKTLDAGLAPVDYSELCLYELTHKIQNFSGFGGLPLTFSGELSSYDFYSGRNEITYTLTAEDGTLTTCSFEVMVEDNEAPEAVCKNVTIHTGQLIVDLALMVNNGSSDNCDLPFLGVYSLDSYPSGCDDVGENTVVLSVRDNSDNIGTCSATVTVRDNQAPTANCQDVTLALDEDGLGSLEASQVDNNSSDNCGLQSLVLSQTSFDCEDVGQQEITMMVIDQNDNSSTCSSTVTVEDNIPPVITCTDATIEITWDYVFDTPEGHFLPDAVLSTVYDACLFYEGGPPGDNLDCSYVGDYTQTVTAYDESGNVSSCSATLSIIETTPPEANCKNAILQLDEMGTATLAVSDVDNGSFDYCGLQSLVLNQTSFDCSAIGDHTVILTVTDVNDNSATCSAQVTVRDNQAPTISCQDYTVQLSNPTLDASGFSIDATDNCSAAEDLFQGITLDSGDPWGAMVPFDCARIGVTHFILEILDESGNHSFCEGWITVVDDVAPLAQCQDLTVELDEDGLAVLEASQVDNNSFDNCGIAAMTLSHTDFDCSDMGDNQVTLSVTDVADNTATCTAIIAITDETPPVVTCEDVTIELTWGESGLSEGILHADEVLANVYDACSFELPTGNTALDCSDIGSFVQTVWVNDVDNESSCSATVTVIETTPPVAHCQPVTVNLSNPILPAADFGAGSTDNCTAAEDLFYVITLPSGQPLGTSVIFGCPQLGVNEYGLDVFDESTNRGSCTSTITVVDDIPPVALCQAITVQLDEDGFGEIEASDINSGSSDACGIASISLSQTSFDCDDVGQQEITLTVIDQSDNSSTCSSAVTVEDNIPPVITCEDRTFELTWDIMGNPMGNVKNDAVLSTAYDACPFSAGGPGSNHLNCGDVGSYIQTVSAYDNSGNSSSCSATITIIETTPPQARCKNATIQLDETGSATLSVSDIDNNSFDYCGLQSLEVSQTSFDCFDLGNHVVELEAVDVNGNAATCTANVSVHGLLCDWTGPEDGIGCPDGSQASYNMATETFAITSAGCYSPAYYRPEDSHGYAGTVLCGDGEIVAHVAGIDGAAWAGVTMRENLEPNARMIQLLVNNSGLARREVRTSTTSAAFVHLFPNNGQHWLRLTRNGNQFGAHISPDGQTWNMVFLVSIQMNDCIDVGLITINEQPHGPASAFFDEVSVIENGIQPLHGVETNTLIHQDLGQPKMDFGLYPNPTSGKVNLQMEQFIGQKVSIEVFNHLGQSIMQKDKMEALDPLEQLDLRRFPSGTYFVKISTATTSVTKRLAVTKD